MLEILRKEARLFLGWLLDPPLIETPPEIEPTSKTEAALLARLTSLTHAVNDLRARQQRLSLLIVGTVAMETVALALRG